MKKIFMFLMVAFAALNVNAQKDFYSYTALDANEEEVSMNDFKGKVLLVVNTATKCGFTPQYTELENIYEKYRDQGFEVLDFPCNQFGEQAPGTYEEIHTFCTGNYNTQFPQFQKIDVNGENEDPIFTYLKSQQGFKGFGEGQSAQFMGDMMKRRDPDSASKSDIKWNFTKFLVDRNGKVIARFEPTEDMIKVEQAVAAALK